MIFAGIDVNIITHEKLATACQGGDLAPFGLWTFGMCHAQLHETNGRMARAVVLTALGGRRNALLAKKLVDAGLWSVNVDGSWQIWNYGKKNQTAEEIRAKKEQSAARVKAWRDRRNAPRNADVTRNETRNKSVRTDPPSEPEPDNTTREQTSLIGRDRPSEPMSRRPMAPVIEPIVAEPKVLGLDGEGGAAWQAWRVGVGRATGKPVADLRASDKPDLVAFVNAHAGGLRGEALMGWISDTAEAFARTKTATYGITTRRCAVWLDGGRVDPGGFAARGAELTKQPFDPAAPWLKLPEVG